MDRDRAAPDIPEAGIPIVSIVGKSDSGKTTVMERLVAELVGRGYRVATAKHHAHEFDIDVPGKDSWRHAQAGATVTMVSSPKGLGVMRRMDREADLDELAREAGDVDILLTEGYKREGRVLIEVSRDARSDSLVCDPAQLTAVITDGVRDVGDVPTFALDDVREVADLIAERFIERSADRS